MYDFSDEQFTCIIMGNLYIWNKHNTKILDPDCWFGYT